MKCLLGIWTVAVALTISAVAAYYSIIGLTAIFAAAVIPVIIMGAVLEIAKITTAVWLHTFWHDTTFLIKSYLTTATIVLMLITSMGIFGFLSKAHIEQAANSTTISAQLERIDTAINREQQTISRANATIDGFDTKINSADTGIQARIASQDRLIADITARLQQDIATQNQLISQENKTSAPIQQELDRIREQRTALTDAQQANDVKRMQTIVGASSDGVLGADTRNKIAEFIASSDRRQTELTTELARLQETDNPIVATAKAEISNLQAAANIEIAKAQEASNTFRQQLIDVTTVDNTSAITAQEAAIDTATDQIDVLTAERFDIEAELRKLEVEVGPVKYIAELMYGEATPELLESSVRAVIIVLVFVFDPLAIVLVIAGLSVMHRQKPTQPIDNTTDFVHTDEINEDEPVDATEEPDVGDDKEEIAVSVPDTINPSVAPLPKASSGIVITTREHKQDNE